MTIAEAEQTLSEQPITFVVEQGCVLADDGLTPQPWTVAKHLERCDGDVARVESMVNRRFIVAHFLDEKMARPLSYASGTMTQEACEVISRVAERYAMRLRTALRQAFPDRTFNVEVIGRDYVEEEPLEVGVTFAHIF